LAVVLTRGVGNLEIKLSKLLCLLDLLGVEYLRGYKVLERLIV
jgi:hypothetical protein